MSDAFHTDTPQVKCNARYFVTVALFDMGNYLLQPRGLDIEHSPAAFADHVKMRIGPAVEAVAAIGDMDLFQHSDIAELVEISVDRSQTEAGNFLFESRIDLVGGGVYGKTLYML